MDHEPHPPDLLGETTGVSTEYAILNAMSTEIALSRLRLLVGLNDLDNKRYTLGALPTGLRWGVRWDKDDHLLCLDGKPLLALLVGEVERAYFVEGDGAPKKFVTVYVRPIRTSDSADAKALLGSLATFQGTLNICAFYVY